MPIGMHGALDRDLFSFQNHNVTRSMPSALLQVRPWPPDGLAPAAELYQVVWLRVLGLVFGHTVYATTTVLAAFMAGLALGSLLAARRMPRLRNLIAVYGWLEIAPSCPSRWTTLRPSGTRSYAINTFGAVRLSPPRARPPRRHDRAGQSPVSGRPQTSRADGGEAVSVAAQTLATRTFSRSIGRSTSQNDSPAKANVRAKASAALHGSGTPSP